MSFRMPRLCLSVLIFLVARAGAAQTSDPIVLCGCAATTVVGWDAPADCSQPLVSPDLGWASTSAPLASPSNYFEHTFVAPAGSYRVWFRVRSLNDLKPNDSVFVQYSDALKANNLPVYRIGTTSALVVNLATDSTGTSLRDWGWVDGAYWLSQTTTVKFAAGGSHRLRVQVREDGVSVDQIILSAATYRTVPPGPPTNDQNRFSCSAPQPPPGPVSNPVPAAGASSVPTNVVLSWTAASNATSYDVAFGTVNPPSVVSSDQTTLTYDPGGLAAATTYYWSIRAKNASGTTPGVIWSFSTAGTSLPPAPGVPSGPAPADLAIDVLAGIGLNWLPSANATTYDVAFGASNPPPLVSANQAGTSYQPSTALAYSTAYFWQVVARGPGGTTAGPLWSFTSAAPPTGDAPSLGNTSLNRLRVVTWNVKQGYNLIDNRNDYNLQIDMMAGLNPDVICLQEVSLADADMPTLVLNGLSARTGRTWRGQYQRQNTATTPTTNNIGSMILTWLPIDAISSTLFTAGLSQPFPAVRLQITVNSTPVHISTTHLYAWDAAVRVAQLSQLQAWLATQGARRVVTGDFNAFPLESALWNGGWSTEYTDAWETATGWIQPTNDGGFTFDRRTATQNPERIDYHWTRGMTVSEMFVVKTRRSDHHAVVVDYKVP